MKALIAMSGGVDSSVAALMMKNAGYDCIGCTMKLYDNEELEEMGEIGADDPCSECYKDSKTCCTLSDAEDARSVAYRLGMSFYVFNYKEEFRKQVIQKFADSYVKGITPNPCIDCNRYLKFGKLYERAKVLGCDVIVTGHYARIEKDEETGLYQLKKAADPTKDQSYVLYSMTQEQLAHTKFPLSTISKTEARQLADENGFINANKPDSQDICFVPDGDYAKVVEKCTGIKLGPGNFVDMDGKVLGKHKGIIHYTVGQRRGLGIASTESYFVCEIRPEDNTVVLGRKGDLMSASADIVDVNWISGVIPKEPVRCKVKIRYKHKEEDAVITVTSDDTAHIEFDSPQRAITPGQSAVFYDGDVVLGGGIFVR